MSEKRNLSWYLAKCPGVVGEIARYIDSRLETHLPGVSLGTAISFVAALKSDKIQSSSGLIPNIYTLCLAPPGTGKTTAQRIITDICSACEIAPILMGQPGSDSGLLKRLQKHPRQLLLWDEFGLALAEISKSSNSYRVAIIKVVMDLFSAANSIYIGKELKGEDRVDLHKPQLSIGAASTPDMFFDTLTEDFINRGFVPRLLVFEEARNFVFKEALESKEIPAPIRAMVRQLEYGDPKKTGGNLEVGVVQDIKTLKLHKPYLKIIKQNAQQRLIDSQSEVECAFWARANEHAVKLCLLFAGDEGECQAVDSMYAWELVEHLTLNLIRHCQEGICENSNEKQSISRARKFKNLILPNETISQSQLTKRASNKGFSKVERRARTEDLLEAGEWVHQVIENPDSLRRVDHFSRAKEAAETAKIKNLSEEIELN
jgi:hypothetical protein